MTDRIGDVRITRDGFVATVTIDKPPINAVSDGAVPRYGTWVIFKPVIEAKSSPAICVGWAATPVDSEQIWIVPMTLSHTVELGRRSESNVFLCGLPRINTEGSGRHFLFLFTFF